MTSCYKIVIVRRRSGGESLTGALAYLDIEEENLPKDPTSYGIFQYVGFSPLLSYIIKEKSNHTPSEYLETYFMPYLGLGKPWSKGEWGWKTNTDSMEYGWIGMSTFILPLHTFIFAYLAHILSHT